MGIPQTTVTRTAVADYAGPVPMGSPCNEYGQDPDAGTNKSSNCTNTGSFWANVGSRNATKGSGDAFQNGVCQTGNDGCSGTTNQCGVAHSAAARGALREPAGSAGRHV